MPKTKVGGENRDQALLEKIFFDHYGSGATEVLFDRSEFAAAAGKL